MPSAALNFWQTDRALRLNEVEAHCGALMIAVPPNPLFLEESLGGYAVHLAGHFQGFCRNLYSECCQIWISKIPSTMRAVARTQFFAQLALDKGNPTYDNVRKDFNRFGFGLDLQYAHPRGRQNVTDLGHLNEWRNRVAHQNTQPPTGGVPAGLTLAIIRDWRVSCGEMAISLDAIMKGELLRNLGLPPW